MAITEATKEMIWLQTFLGELDQDHDGSMLYSDNQSAIQLAKNPVYHASVGNIAHLKIMNK